MNIKRYKDFKINSNFSKWFKNSKVVDKFNKPLKCYHGTRSIFKEFKSSSSIGNQGENDQIEGIYFTSNKEGASFYSLNNEKKYLMEVFLSIQNPYIVNNYKELSSNLGIEKLSEVNSKLKSLGYDGLIIEKGFYSNGGPYKLFLAFYPTQIKSVENNGEWNPEKNDIYS